MSDAGLQTQGGLEAQPVMPVRRLNNYVYCPRLFYFQWVEDIFQESADTIAGSHVHRHVDAPSRFDDEKRKALAQGLPEGTQLRSLRLESESCREPSSFLKLEAFELALHDWPPAAGPRTPTA